MDVEPLEAVLGIVLIGIALTSVLALRPRVHLSSELYRRQVARSLASVVAYYYVHEFAYGPLNGTQLNATLYNWSRAVADDTGLRLVVQLGISNGTEMAGSYYVINQTLIGDVTVVEKPAPVYLPPNGTIRGYVVPARDVYRYGTEDLKMDEIRAFAAFVYLPSGVSVESRTVDVEVDLPFRDCGSCVGEENCTSQTVNCILEPDNPFCDLCDCVLCTVEINSCTICSGCPPDHTLSGTAEEENLTYQFSSKLDPIEHCYQDIEYCCNYLFGSPSCGNTTGSTCVTSPYKSSEDDTILIKFVYDPGTGGLNILAEVAAPVREKQTVPNRPWLDIDKHLAFVGESIEITYGSVGDLEVRSAITGKVLFRLNGVGSVTWELTDPLLVSPGPWIIHMSHMDDEYNSANLVLIAPYVLIVKVYAAGGV
ncbi:MAG: hypothetical protein QI223_01230 [Candidatus Korarchaeota archaeon]|nr:hypothetical protein [Candidatus Korarchaeota archaeon]